VPKKPRRGKHVPQRTCVGCREVHSKRSLIRVVRNPEGIFVDPSGKMAGRGAYLHEQRQCWEIGLEIALARALKTDLSTEDKKRLAEFIATLPDD
jgi:predicted RNA-binding protein YlxR (DUF448 family)